MITGSSYGHTGNTSMAYYYLGTRANYAKFGVGVAGLVEASFLSAFQENVGVPISNINAPKVDTYSNVRSAFRFFQGITGTIHNFPAFNRRPIALPNDALWLPYT